MSRRISTFIRLLITTIIATIPSIATAETIVSDTVNTTTWTAEGSPYRVTDRVTVPEGNTLSIEPGVDVLVSDSTLFVVTGALKAVGTQSDSIRFLSVSDTDTTGWFGIQMHDADPCTLRFVRVSGIMSERPSCFISPGAYSHFYEYGALSVNTDLYMSRSVFSSNRNALTSRDIDGDVSIGGGFTIGGYGARSSVIIDSCVFADNQSGAWGGGLSIVGDVDATVRSCTMVDNVSRDGGSGVMLALLGEERSQMSSPHVRFERCLLAGNDVTGSSRPVGGSAIALTEPKWVIIEQIQSLIHAEFINCTIVDNNNVPDGSVISVGDFGMALVKNGVVWGNSPSSVEIKSAVYADPTIDTYNFRATYSDIEVESGIWPGTDNINADPQFVDAANNDYSLGPLSPCIDAGDQYFVEDDLTRPDLGHTNHPGEPLPLPRIETDIDSVTVRSNPQVSVEIRNDGTTDLTITSVVLPDSFWSENIYPFTLRPGQESSIDVLYRNPLGSTGHMTIISNDPHRAEISIAVRGLGSEQNPSAIVSGTWKAQYSPYHIVENVVIPHGEKLIIEPGVDVIFDGSYKITAYGSIDAIGTETDSIRFYPAPGIAWSGIYIKPDEDIVNVSDPLFVPDSSKFRYVRFSGARGDQPYESGGTHGILETRFVSLNLSNVVFRDILSFRHGALQTDNCDVIMDSCKFINNGFLDDTIYSVGAASHISNGTIVMRDCVFRDNVSATGSFGRGGAISVVFADVSMERCRFTGNHASTEGGAIYVRDHAYVIMTDCIIDSNSVDSGYGGAVYVAEPAIATPRVAGTLHMIGGSVVGNFASVAGGAFYPPERPVTWKDTDIHGNTPADLYTSSVPRPEPAEFALHQNIPNPFNPSTTIKFALPTSGHVVLTLYDITGRQVRTLVEAHTVAGNHSVVWNGQDAQNRTVGSGIYIMQLRHDNNTQTRRMTLLR
jgi:predicted outer membrane repeat protein